MRMTEETRSNFETKETANRGKRCQRSNALPCRAGADGEGSLLPSPSLPATTLPWHKSTQLFRALDLFPRYLADLIPQVQLWKLDEIFRAGPKTLPADEINVLKVWAHKMLARIGRADAEGKYRRVWLRTELLEDYCHIRGLWCQGPKKAHRWLAEFDVPTYDAMLLALEPHASNDAICRLVQVVAGNLDA